MPVVSPTPSRRYGFALLVGAVITLGMLPAGAQESGQASEQEGGFFSAIADFFNPERKIERENPTIDAVRYTVDIQTPEAPSALRSQIVDASNLEALKTRPPAGAAGLIRRVIADGDRITAALYAAGHYGGTIDLTISGNRPDTPNIFDIVEAARKRGPVPVLVVVHAGPEFVFGSVRIIDTRTRGEMADAPPLRRLRLEPGQPALASAIVAAEDTLVNHWRNAGYPFAKVASKDIVADHATRKLNVTLYVDPGRQATFGRFTVSGADFLTPGFIEERIDIRPGEPYVPERLAALRRRLGKIESLGSIRIREAERLDPDGSLPIHIEVTERPSRYVGFSAKYSNTDGSSLNAFWGHRNLFGGGETLRLDATASWFGETSEAVPDADPFGYRLSATFMKPGIITANDDLLLAAAALREVTNAYVRQGFTFTGGVRRRFDDNFTMQLGVDFEDSTVEDADYKGDYFIVGIPLDATFDNTDSPLDPTRGIRASATVEPFAYLGDSGAGPVMAKGTVSAYYAMDEDKRFVLAGRASAGTILGADLYDVPTPRRFFVGGGGSLRGYDFQAASPRNANGIIIGGLSYFEASAELRLRITDTIGIVPFFDMGAAFSSEVPDFDGMKYSAGIGLRYFTGIGPLRLDFAVPLNPGPRDGSYGIYISLGQAF